MPLNLTKNNDINYILTSNSDNTTRGELRIGSDLSNVFLTINTAGNIGIGTTSPSQTLDVSGTIRINNNQIANKTSFYPYIQYCSVSGDFTKHVVASSNKVYLSTDSGSTYSSIYSATLNLITAIHISRDGNYIAVGCGNNFTESSDNGETWSTPVMVGEGSILFIKTTHNVTPRSTVVLSGQTSTDRLYKKQAGGVFSLILSAQGDVNIELEFGMSDDGKYIMQNYLFGAVVSINNGTTFEVTGWENFSSGWPIYRMLCSGSGQYQVAIATYQWVYSINYGATWTLGNNKYDHSLTSPNTNSFIALSNDGTKVYVEEEPDKIFRYTLSGSSYGSRTQVATNLGSVIRMAMSDDGTKILATYAFDTPFVITTDSGTNITEKSINEFINVLSTPKIGINVSPNSYLLELSQDSAAKPSTTTWTVSSDERLKTGITIANLETCYDNIKNIPLKRYTWLNEVYSEEQVKDRSKLGWIAQDVETVFPKAVSQKDRYGLSDCRDLNSDQIIASLYGCVQKLMNMNENLRQQLESRKVRIQNIKNNIQS